MVQKITSSFEYHRHTAYSRSKMSGHSLDWANQPDVYKAYDEISKVPLGGERSLEEQDLWQMFQRSKPLSRPVINFQTISDILRMTNRLTARARYPGQDFYYRSVASAGALYPNEIYLAHNGIPDLPPGLYHYGIGNQTLHPLRQEKILGPLLKATGFSKQTQVAASLMISGIFFRSAWKYRARAYRYILLDAGHVIENLIPALQCLSIPFSLHFRFDDREMNHILGVNGMQEACVAVVHLHQNPEEAAQVPDQSELPPLPESILGASRVSAKEVVYPEILSIHEAGIPYPDLTETGMLSRHDLGITVQHWQTIEWNQAGTQSEKYPDLLVRRRSKRNYIPRSIPLNDFWGLLDLVCHSYGFAEPTAGGIDSLQIGFLAERVEGLTPGFYLLDPHARKIGLVQPGQMTGVMTDACLNQDWLANASVHFLFLANLRFLDQHWGARGYRYAMITAGRIGQMVYLGATALHMGACGIGAFYDDEAETILGLNADSSLLYLVAAGPVKRL